MVVESDNMSMAIMTSRSPTSGQRHDPRVTREESRKADDFSQIKLKHIRLFASRPVEGPDVWASILGEARQKVARRIDIALAVEVPGFVCEMMNST